MTDPPGGVGDVGPGSSILGSDAAAYLDSAPDPIVVVDREGVIRFFSRRAEQMFGHDAAAIVGRSVDLLLPPRLRAGHAARRDGYTDEPRVRSMGDAESEVIAVDVDGNEFPVEVSLSPVRIGDELTVMAAVRDISERLRYEAQLRESEAFFRALGDIRAAILAEHGSDRVLTRITTLVAGLWPGASAYLAATDATGSLRVRSAAGEHPGAARGDVLHGTDSTVAAAMRARSTVGEDGPPSRVIAPFLGVHRIEGALVVTEATPGSVNVAMVEALANEAEMSLEIEAAANDRRRQLVTSDRERIARDLHDLVIQRLFAAGMRLQSAMGMPDALDTRAREVVRELDETISEIRNTIFKLTEPDTSLREQLRALVDAFVADHGTTITVTAGDAIEELPDDVAGHLLATVNEAVSNALRHAGASRVTVDVTVTDVVELTVVDDGGGLRGSGAQPRANGRGLTNMAERAAALGGEVAFATPAEGGTRFTWRVPLPTDETTST